MADLIAPDELPPVATATQVAKVMQTTVEALAQDRYRRRGIPYVKIGGRVRYLREDVLKFLAANRVGESVPPRPPATPLTTWLTPAICEVLAEHEPATFEDQTRVSCGDSVGAHHYQSFPDQQAWRDHVAPLIAERVANLLPLIQPK